MGRDILLQSQILDALLGSRFVEHVQHLHRVEGSHLAQQFGDFGMLVVVEFWFDLLHQRDQF